MPSRYHSPLFTVLLALASFVSFAAANVEKVIFLGPEPVNIPLQKPTISDLNLNTLTPNITSHTVRTRLSRQLAQDSSQEPRSATWLVLDSLTQGQRYELRVSWSALEPTNFALDVYDLDTVWQDPDLIQSLARYAASLEAEVDEEHQPYIHTPPPDNIEGEKKSSVLLLRIIAIADYFTHHTELMSNPPPVLTDITLDPFLYNVLPRSLLPTVAYLVLVAIVTWFVAKWIASFLQSVAGRAQSPQKKNQ